ncbi:MAG: WecB/TagA/CpsF family glycosyltransferase [Pirellulales bacterium]
MIDRGKHNVLGVRINAVDYDAAVEQIIESARRREPLAVTALAVHGVMTGALDPVHRWRLNKLDLVVPDGQPVRWALNLLHGCGLRERVYGPELMLRVCDRAAAEGLGIFLFGGPDDLLDTLTERLVARFPGLQIVGRQASKFRRMTPAEKEETIDNIRRSGAHLTLVGIGCPRQEVWAFEFREALSMPLMAVGAAFPFHAGLLPQAPPMMQRWGLEWLFRLSCEPRRLWNRYIVLNPLYLAMLGMQMTRLRVQDPEACQPPTEELLYG